MYKQTCRKTESKQPMIIRQMMFSRRLYLWSIRRCSGAIRWLSRHRMCDDRGLLKRRHAELSSGTSVHLQIDYSSVFQLIELEKQWNNKKIDTWCSIQFCICCICCCTCCLYCAILSSIWVIFSSSSPSHADDRRGRFDPAEKLDRLV